MVGANKAPLATIAGENYGVIGGINGGYFSGAKPIGVLRRQGHMDNAKFWPNRSAFGWNDKGETIFIDGKEIANISGNGQLDIYTEMMQAGPLLMKKGSVALWSAQTANASTGPSLTDATRCTASAQLSKRQRNSANGWE